MWTNFIKYASFTDWGVVAIAVGLAVMIIVVLICDTILKLHGILGF